MPSPFDKMEIMPDGRILWNGTVIWSASGVDPGTITIQAVGDDALTVHAPPQPPNGLTPPPERNHMIHHS